jgi:DNA-binding transcriptional LysR family regulator
MDDPLFVRGPDGLVPTARAEEVQVHVREILERASRCLQPLSHFEPESAGGRIRLGAPDRLSVPIALPFLVKVRSQAPIMTVELTTTDREQALDLIAKEGLDLALGWFDHPPIRLSSLKVFSENLVCVMRKDHPIASARRQLTLSKLLEFPHLVVSSAGDRKAAFDILLSREGLTRIAAITVGNFTMVPNILLGTDLVSVFTERVAGTLCKSAGLVSKPLPLEIQPLDHYMVWDKRFDADQRHLWIRDQLISVCG